ncbi:MAG: MarR family transcriptional regulator [Phycisphaeraceae bacterium]|nr:MAG: MarR family transcriptional regulator [Phycisphaeraceae bacterium]
MAERFHGTRRAHRDETAEDYAEAILNLVEREGVCRVRDLSGMMGVSHVTVTRIVSRLQKLGLVETEPYRPIGLTARGLRVARAARRRHGVVLGFLLSIGVPPRQAEIDAEGIEHHVSGATIRALRRLAMNATRAGARPITGSGRRTDG